MSLENSPELSIPFDPSLYPRTYKSSLGWRLFLISLGALIAAAALLGLWYFGTGHESQTRQSALIMVVVCLAFFLLGAYLVVAMLKSKLILTADVIELHEPFVTKSLLRSQIAGWRVIPTQYVSTLEFTPRDPHAKTLKFAFTIKPDDAFNSWMSALPNLDAQELEQSRAELETNLDLGLTEEQRAENLAAASKYAKYLTGLSYVAAVWGWFYPQPYSATILILSALPLAAILLGLRSKGVYQFEGRRNDARPSLAVPMMMPGFILALRALYDLSLLHWQQLLAPVLLVTAAMTAFVASADPSIAKRRWPVLLFFVLSLAYGSGVTALADALLDRSLPEIYQTQVLFKRMDTGSRHTTWYLRIAPWGPQQHTSEVGVPRSFYSTVQLGQTVCVHYHPGALKIPWYVIASCPANSTVSRRP